MLRKISVGVLAVAFAGFAGSAMAVPFSVGQIDNQNYGVGVNIEVHPIVSVWGFENQINLEMTGADGNNFAGHDSTFAYINNVLADIDVKVEQGSGTALPAGINFFIFDNVTSAAAQVLLQSNAYTQPSALVWTNGTLGSSQGFDDNIPVNLPGGTRNIAYVVDQPGGVTVPDQYNLNVTWTISASP